MRLNLLRPRYYWSEFKRLKAFVIAPDHNPYKSLTISEKIEGTWFLFVVKFLLAIIVGVTIGIFFDPENKTTISMAARFSASELFFVTVIALPLLEEVGFRLSLRFRPVFLALTLGVFGYYIASKALYHVKLSDIHTHFTERVTVIGAILIISYPLLSIPKVKKKLERLWQTHFKWIFYIFCLTFAWMHIFNYELSTRHLLLMPLITLPKLVSAVCFGYARINYGFIYSFAIHAANNIIGFISSVLISSSD
ncbi:CPBP family glutamic-type intramembrane protease [Roseivirga sp. E12]|uniref:CPBP family glutamic-type intramembrane protease n=1 Tax=Roseivirga sp. E12 TaxID=2819237 RepID=UPI001ABC22B3|nr:CPBP family glutamic-type intramembrane protease [Roseivirga sp. E12]MBO3697242.1 CPBP family intramembrane metalloprotease [Roseivirga sp. E12]